MARRSNCFSGFVWEIRVKPPLTRVDMGVYFAVLVGPVAGGFAARDGDSVSTLDDRLASG